MANSMQTFEREKIALPPEDYAFLSGVMTALTAMYCRLRPVPAEPEPEPKKEENHENHEG